MNQIFNELYLIGELVICTFYFLIFPHLLMILYIFIFKKAMVLQILKARVIKT